MKNERKKSDEKRKMVEIYNLVFPTNIETLEIGDYVFHRTVNYTDAIKGLSYRTEFINDDIHAIPQQGTNQITAIVELPENEKDSVLPWTEKGLKQLDDILFLLTILKSRWIFKKDERNLNVLGADSRKSTCGGILETSLIKKTGYLNPVTRQIVKNVDANTKDDFCCCVNIGLDSGINKVLNVISRRDWQEEYDKGHFLFLFRSAMRAEYLEATFVLCWSIWEHIFSQKHGDWLDPNAIRNLSVENKISYILNQYFNKTIDTAGRRNLKKLIKNRHRIVRFGKARNVIYEESKKELRLFIHLTECLIAIILELEPSNIFDTKEKLEKFLSSK